MIYKLVIDAQPMLFIGHIDPKCRQRSFHSTPETKRFEQIGSSRFYTSSCEKFLLKIVQDKKRGLFKRFLRQISRRIFLRATCRKEYKGNKIFRDAGLKTIVRYGWGVALNPLNTYGCFYVMSYEKGLKNGRQYYPESDIKGRKELIVKMEMDFKRLIESGFYTRDPHSANVLIKGDDVVWIDTHAYPINILLRGLSRQSYMKILQRKTNADDLNEQG